MEAYTTVKELAESAFTERRSRFLSAITPVSTPEEAAEFVAARRAHYHDAAHTVYAYLLRDGSQKYSDDGEPQGTGGLPVLEVLRKNGLSDVAVAVTRYFGGILLGAGGLTRAYTRGAADAVAAAKRITYAPCAVVEVRCDYNQYGRIQNAYPKLGAKLLSSDFATDVTLHLLMAQEVVPEFMDTLTELTAATAQARLLEEVFAALDEA